MPSPHKQRIQGPQLTKQGTVPVHRRARRTGIPCSGVKAHASPAMPWATSHAQSPRHTRWQRVVATGLPSSRLDSPAGPMGAPNRTHPQGLLILPRGPAVVQGSSLASAVTLLPRAATSIKTGLPLYPACTIEDPPPCRRHDVLLADEACGARSPIMEGGEAGAMKTDGQDVGCAPGGPNGVRAEIPRVASGAGSTAMTIQTLCPPRRDKDGRLRRESHALSPLTSRHAATKRVTTSPLHRR